MPLSEPWYDRTCVVDTHPIHVILFQRDQGENQEKKLTNDELETAAAEHADDFDEAWEALEVARMVFEKAE